MAFLEVAVWRDRLRRSETFGPVLLAVLIGLAGECLIVILRRADRVIVPRGNTVIEPGDVLVMLTTRANEHRLRRVGLVAGEGLSAAQGAPLNPESFSLPRAISAWRACRPCRARGS